MLIVIASTKYFFLHFSTINPRNNFMDHSYVCAKVNERVGMRGSEC